MTPQEIKNSILQRAIQGKLVEHLESEKSVVVHSSYGGEIADFFEIPDNWKWLAIKDVATVTTGLSFKKQDQKDSSNGTLRVLRGGNIGDDYKYHLYEDDVYVDLEQFRSKYISLLKGDVITPSVTSMEKICKTGFIDKNLDSVTAGGFVYIIRCLSSDVLDAKYLLYFISSTFNKEQCKPNIHKSGQAFYNLKKTGFVEQPICVPPLAEQKRIVAKIEELLPLVDRYEAAWTRLEDFNRRFPEDMKKSILQHAIEGKLVEQRPEEGTAQELYQQIQAEKQRLIKEGKIKKEKPLPEITEDEKPFEIPESWMWVSVGSVSVNIQYGSSQKSATSGKVAVLRMGNIQDGKLILDKLVYTSNEAEIEKYPLKYNDLLFNRTNSKELVGKTAIYKGEIPAIYAGYLVRITPLYMNSDYLNYVMQSQFYWSYCQSVRSDAIGQSNINAEKLKRFVFPLPPLAEQKRIVARLEELLPLCEQLK